MNTIVGYDEKDGYPIYGHDFELVEGLRIGKLIVIERTSNPINQKTQKPMGGIWYKCQCDCGAIVVKRKDNLKAGALKGGPCAQKNKGCRTCGAENCNNSGIKNRNTTGLIESSHIDTNVAGNKILSETGYIDLSNRSEIIICECPFCGQPYPTTRRSSAISCGCLIHKPVRLLEDYIAQRQCRSKGEQSIFDLLEKNNVPFIQEKRFSACKDLAALPFDFYLESPRFGKYVIEYDGEQHFKANKWFGNFENTRKHDLMKNRFCWENGIKIIRIPYDVEFVLNDLSLATTRFLLTPQNEKEYYESRG